MREFIILLISGFLLSKCYSGQRNNVQYICQDTEIKEIKKNQDILTSLKSKESSGLEKKLDSIGLININELDTSIIISLKYASTDNFTGEILYHDLNNAYLQPDVAAMLVQANKELKKIYPHLYLIIYDAARPLSIQKIMWDKVKDTSYKRYVAEPSGTGMHNYGAAVDVTLADSSKNPLDMGTPFDHFGKAASVVNEKQLMEEGLLTEKQLNNRQILRNIMRQAGFRTISGEWWHFNACSLKEAKDKYQLIE